MTLPMPGGEAVVGLNQRVVHERHGHGTLRAVREDGSCAVAWDDRVDRQPVLVDELHEPQVDHLQDDAAEAEALAAIKFNEDVARKAREIQILEAARARVAAEKRANQPRPRLVRLDEFLATPSEDPTYRINEVWPTGGRIMLAAQFKAGKSTLVANLLRSLADGARFLDRFTVRPGARIVLIDNELDERTLHRWLTDQGINNTGAIRLVPLRGQLTTFDIRDPDVRAEWAADMAGADVVVLDCLRPILDALGLDENHEAGRFLVPFDALLAEAGATEAVVVHHMGHAGERERGDSRLKDWPDASWKLVRDKDDDDPTTDDTSGTRYFSAFGRDVNVVQAELEYDPDTRHLTLSADARTRKQATEDRRVMRARDAVLEVVGATPGISKSQIREATRAHGISHNPQIDQAVQALVTEGRIVRHKVGRTHMHYLHGSPTEAMLPTMPNGAQGTVGAYVPNAPIGHGHMQATSADAARTNEGGHRR